MNEFAGCRPLTLDEVLAEREARAFRQKQLLAQYGSPLICFTLNIAGEYKTFPLALRCFREGVRIIALTLEAENLKIACRETAEGGAGYSAYIAVDADAGFIKTLAAGIEEAHPLGRLFDIDVLRPDGEKLSRAGQGGSPRPCFVCGENAFACARERRHEPRDVARAMIGIMNDWLRKSLSGRIEAAALRALMGEVAATPKPGLVDRNNNGAHTDMDFFSFIDSAAAILPYFRECALAGFDSGPDARRLFDSLRHGGKIAERRMLAASGGVNVHKGIIFSLGVLSAAYGKLYRTNDSPSLDDCMKLCRNMSAHLLEDFAGVTAQEAASSGERLYARYGITGIRGEVSQGFPHVCTRSLPVLRLTLENGHTMNDAGIAALLTLLACAGDTNIIHRGGIAAASRIQKKIGDFLAANPSMEDMLRMARETDAQFIKDNISAGGCADLLAVTYFLYYLIFEPRP